VVDVVQTFLYAYNSYVMTRDLFPNRSKPNIYSGNKETEDSVFGSFQ
jgi:hypothetical protein